MSKNFNLNKAKENKNDEFYTQLADIEKELQHYEYQFEDKHVFCNCDDPEFSNFWRYFALNFKHLGLKRLTSTHYEHNKSIPSYQMDMYREVPESSLNKETFMTLEERGINLPLGYITPLEEDGDFRSPESLAILEECDIVVTNPPFSLFREYISLLIEYEKKIVILGTQNAIKYKEIFSFIQDNKLWIGHNANRTLEFAVPSTYEFKKGKYRVDEDGTYYVKNAGITWLTNLDVGRKRNEGVILYKNYNPTDYYTYDNFEAIDVALIKDIPIDYYDIMGVPITILNNYNPEQFILLGMGTGNTAKKLGVRKNYRGRTDLAYTDENGIQKCPYTRLLIKRKYKNDGSLNI